MNSIIQEITDGYFSTTATDRRFLGVIGHKHNGGYEYEWEFSSESDDYYQSIFDFCFTKAVTRQDVEQKVFQCIEDANLVADDFAYEDLKSALREGDYDPAFPK